MIVDQHLLFQHEDQMLAPYALRASQSRGRKYDEPEDPYRTPFQRDRDRVIHSKAFRRLSGKTQVFVASHGDHYRSRLTHSLEVAQVSRDIARALGLNEDLCEVIALAHDLGHTPFGHGGEEAMDQMMARFGDSFEHNDQSCRVVKILEKKSPEHPGLNLSFETIEGMMKHRKQHDDGKTPVVHSLESQVVDLSDAIAYHHHDLDDGLRSGILNYESLMEGVELWRMATEELSIQELGENLYRHIAINRVISILINDVIEHSDATLQKEGVTAPLDEKSQKLYIGYSPKIQERAEQLAAFLGEEMYLNDTITSQIHKGQKIIKSLFQLYSERDDLLPQRIRAELDQEERHIVIKDYIAGMTDAYAIGRFNDFKDFL